MPSSFYLGAFFLVLATGYAVLKGYVRGAIEGWREGSKEIANRETSRS